jgi:hypothetical protein
MTETTRTGDGDIRNAVERLARMMGLSGDDLEDFIHTLDGKGGGRGDITMTSYEADDWRVTRMAMVAGYAQALADAKGIGPILDDVAAMHDHKGVLEVTWRIPPAEKHRECFRQAWGGTVGDGFSPVEHVMATAGE